METDETRTNIRTETTLENQDLSFLLPAGILSDTSYRPGQPHAGPEGLTRGFALLFSLLKALRLPSGCICFSVCAV